MDANVTLTLDSQEEQFRPGKHVPRATQLLLHLLEFAGLLDAAQRSDDRIEQVEQQEHAVLVEMQLAIARRVALAGVVVQTLQQRRELVEVLESGDIGLLDLWLGAGS